MKVAVASATRFIDESVATKARFGEYLLIADIDTMEYEAIVNPINALRDKSAIRLFAEILLDEDISKLFLNDCKPEITEALEASGIQVIDGISGTVRETIKHFKKICNSETMVIPAEAIRV
jgi:predicted Fe-Mo cluster-binding NifX family protein